jgi:transcription initiation factor TFIIIB Brf1 subunit/transcription initiation factor TFIIB
MRERTISIGFEEINALSKRLNICEKVSDDAKKIFLQALDSGYFLRSPRDGARAALYAACRSNGESISFNYIGGFYVEDRKKVFRAYLQIKRGLNLSPAPVNAIDLLPGLCSRLGVPDGVESKARDILCRLDTESSDGRSPQIVALASISIASASCGYKISFREMHDMTGSNASTIKYAARSMTEELGMEPVIGAVRNLCSLLSLPLHVSRTALDILSEVEHSSVNALKRPIDVIAAGVVCLAAKRSDFALSVKDVSDRVGVNEQSAKKIFNEMERIFQ